MKQRPDMSPLAAPHKISRLARKEIDSRLAVCPSLPSLSSINKALQGLLQAEQRYSSHISEIVRRDPSLTSRLLRLVNSVYYGLATPVSSMPISVQYFTLINPLRYAIEIAQRVYLEGAGIGRLMPDLWPMAIIAAVTLSAASWMFRHRLE